MKHSKPERSAGGRDDVAARLLSVRRQPVVSEIGRRLLGECRVPAGARLVVAVSGGADSCALLLACQAVAARVTAGGPTLQIVAAHVNHHLRPEADEEQAFVEALCASLGVPVHVEHIHPGEERGSKAANARRMRYAALEGVAQRVDAAFVASAHHAEDQLETMLMALGRGAGLRGVRGMTWSRPLSDDIMLVRPMLLARKQDCEALCKAAGVAWREDPSNVDPRSKRARIRRDVVPVLEELWPGAARRSVGTAELIDTAGQLMAKKIKNAFGSATTHQWPRQALAELPRTLIAEGLRRAAENLHGGALLALGQRHLRAAASVACSDEQQPKRFEWPGDLVVDVTAKSVSISRA